MLSGSKNTLIHVEDAFALKEEVDELSSSILSLKSSLHCVVLVSDLLHGLVAQLHLLAKELVQHHPVDIELDVIFEHLTELLEAQWIPIGLEEVLQVSSCSMMDFSKLTTRFVLGEEFVNINLFSLSNAPDARIADAIELGQNPHRHILTLDSLDALKLKFQIIITSLTLKPDLLGSSNLLHEFLFFIRGLFISMSLCSMVMSDLSNQLVEVNIHGLILPWCLGLL